MAGVIMGFLGFVYRQVMVHPQPPPFQDLSGQTILVTGANIGIGLQAARQLMSFQANRVILAVRSLSKGDEAKTDLLESHPSCDVQVWELDMESFDSIEAFGKRAQGLDRLDVAILNAGVKKLEYSRNKPAGHETTIQVNHLATALLSLLLLPPLRASAAKNGRPSRMTITSSEVHMWASFNERSAPNIIERLDDKTSFGNPDRYYVSKLLNVLWTRELAAKVSPTEIIVNTVNPGLVQSTLHRENKSAAEKKFIAIFGRTTEEGGRTLVDAAVVKGAATHGGYLSECKQVPYVPTPFSFHVRSTPRVSRLSSEFSLCMLLPFTLHVFEEADILAWPGLTFDLSASTWVSSAEGAQIQKKLWTETLDVFRTETRSDIENYVR